MTSYCSGLVGGSVLSWWIAQENAGRRREIPTGLECLHKLLKRLNIASSSYRLAVPALRREQDAMHEVAKVPGDAHERGLLVVSPPRGVERHVAVGVEGVGEAAEERRRRLVEELLVVPGGVDGADAVEVGG